MSTSTQQSPSFEEAVPALRVIARQRASRILGEAEADDIAQEALMRASQHWDRISSYAEPWVSRVATNAAIGVLRRRRPDHELRFEVRDSSADLRLDMARALAELPERQREVVVLRHVVDLSERETAAALGISPGSVKRHLHRALARLGESAALAAHRPIDDTSETTMSTTIGFIEAVPLPDWPARPWDHRFVEADGDIVERVAIDDHGRIILDADGDEVMTGPAFDRPVKCTRPEAPPEDRLSRADFEAMDAEIARSIPWPELDADAQAVVERARRLASLWGHPWIGTDHLDMALLELHPEPSEAALGTDLAELSLAKATFHEGRFASERLRMVAERDRTGWQPPDVEGALAFDENRALRLVLAAAGERAGGPVTVPHLIAATAADDLLRSHMLERLHAEGG